MFFVVVFSFVAYFFLKEIQDLLGKLNIFVKKFNCFSREQNIS